MDFVIQLYLIRRLILLYRFHEGLAVAAGHLHADLGRDVALGEAGLDAGAGGEWERSDEEEKGEGFHGGR